MTRNEQMWKAVEQEHGNLSIREAFVTLTALDWADKTMIDKACEWLLNIDYDNLRYRDFGEEFNEELFVNDFRKAMEE